MRFDSMLDPKNDMSDEKNMNEPSPRKQYRTRAYWIKFDMDVNVKFPINTLVRFRGRGGQISEGFLRTRCHRGKVEIENAISGKRYPLSAESLISPTGKDADEFRALFKSNDRDPRPERIDQVRPVTKEPKLNESMRIRPWTEDETIAHTTIKAVMKAINRIRANPDSFRNSEIHNVLFAAESCLNICVKELESYDRLPD